MPPRDPAHDGGQDVGIEGVVAFDRSPTQAPFPRLCSVGATCFGAKNSKKSSAAFPIPTRVPGATDPRVGVIDNGIGSALAPWTLGRIDHLTATQVDAVHGTNVAGILLAGQSANGPAIPPERGGRELHDGAEEMAGMVLFLCSGAVSHVTGQALVVDGGQTSIGMSTQSTPLK